MNLPPLIPPWGYDADLESDNFDDEGEQSDDWATMDEAVEMASAQLENHFSQCDHCNNV